MPEPYYYVTKLPNGRVFDPESYGGAVTQLRLINVETNTVAETIPDPERVSYGVYKFEIPDTVLDNVYLGDVTYTRDESSAPTVDDTLVISIPERPRTKIRPWVSLLDVINYHPDVKGIPGDIALDMIDFATQLLYGLSGRKYRGRQTSQELYSCGSSSCLSGMGDAMGWSHRRRGHDPIIQLRGRPAQKVLQVSVDATGAILPPHLWQLVNARYLEPTRAGGWSPCQGVRVTYIHGVNPTRVARAAALTLAGNLALRHQNSDACRLPANVTSVSRQGLSFSIFDPQDFIKDGRTGIYEVDLFLKSANPDNARKPARVLIPDGHQSRSIAAVKTVDHIKPYPLVVQMGRPVDLTYSWRPYGIPNRIDEIYTLRAQAGAVDLTPYITVERENEPGRVDLDIPADVAMTLPFGETWYLEAQLIADPTNIQRLLTGEIHQSM